MENDLKKEKIISGSLCYTSVTLCWWWWWYSVTKFTSIESAMPSNHLYLIYDLVAKSYLTLCDPMDCSLPGSSVHGIFQTEGEISINPTAARSLSPLSCLGFSKQEYWSGLPFPSPGDLPHPGIEPVSPALQADSTTQLPGKPPVSFILQLQREKKRWHAARRHSGGLLTAPVCLGLPSFLNDGATSPNPRHSGETETVTHPKDTMPE